MKKVSGYVKKCCVLVAAVSMMTLLVACGSAKEQEVSTAADNAVVTQAPAKETPAPTVTEAPTPEPTQAPTPEPVDVGTLIKTKIRYDDEGTATDTYIYTYNEWGLIAKEEYIDVYNWEGAPQVTEYIYDDSGKLLRKEYNAASSDGMFRKETDYYDENGNVVKNEYSDIFTTRLMTYTYDEKGNLIEETFDIDEMSTKTRYEYDQYGNVTKESQLVDGEEVTGRSYKYEYYGDGTVKTKESYYGDERNLIEEYYENGNLRVVKSMSGDSCTQVTEYDENGNCLLYESYSNKLDFDTMTSSWVVMWRYEYDYSFEDNTYTYTTKDGEGKVVSTELKLINPEIPQYDENGKMVSMKEYFGPAEGYGTEFYYLHTYEYDAAGNLTKEECFSYYNQDNGAYKWRIEYTY